MRNISFFSVLVIFSILLSGCFKSKARLQEEEVQKEMRKRISLSVDEHSDRMDNIAKSMGELIGKVEAIEFTQKKEKEGLRNSMLSFGEQLTSLSAKMEKVEKMQKEIVKDMGSLKKGSFVKKGSSSFRQGINAFNKKRYKSAISIFQAYINRYPRAKNALRARELLGESYYSLGKYEDTIIAYSAIYERQKKGRLWRKSVLRIAQSFYKLGKKSDAKSFASTLVEAYPKSKEAKQAKKYL